MAIPTLHTVVTGDVTSQPVIVLGSSLGTTTHAWDGLMDALSRDHAVVRFDLPGHGESAPATGPFSLAELAAAVIESVDRLGVTQFDYAGVSVNGGLALELAHGYPEQVKHAAAICTAASFGGPEPARARAEAVRQQGTASQLDGLAERWFSAPTREQSPQLVKRFEDMVANTSTEGFAQVVEALGTHHAEDYLGDIRVPVLVISGADDPGTTPAAGKVIADGVPGARQIVIEHAAHQAPAEHPELVAKHLLTFFAS